MFVAAVRVRFRVYREQPKGIDSLAMLDPAGLERKMNDTFQQTRVFL